MSVNKTISENGARQLRCLKIAAAVLLLVGSLGTVWLLTTAVAYGTVSSWSVATLAPYLLLAYLACRCDSVKKALGLLILVSLISAGSSAYLFDAVVLHPSGTMGDQFFLVALLQLLATGAWWSLFKHRRSEV